MAHKTDKEFMVSLSLSVLWYTERSSACALHAALKDTDHLEHSTLTPRVRTAFFLRRSDGKMARELVPHKQVVPPVHIDTERLAKMLQQHMYNLECIIKKMQREIPIYVDEYLYSQNATQLIVLPQSQNLENITAFFAIVSAPGGATLTLGGSSSQTRTIPLAQGNTFFYLGPSGMLLNNGDARQITQGTSGVLALELFGFEIPDKGTW